MNEELENIFKKVIYKDKSSLITRFESRRKKVQEILNRNPRPSHLEGLSEDSAFLRVSSYSDLSNIMDIGYYNGIKTNNPIEYNNALYTFARLNTERMKLIGSGNDHCILFPYVLDHLACGEISLARNLFKMNLGKSKKGHRFLVCATNLLQSIFNDNDLLSASSIKDADVFLKKKNPKFENYTVEFLRSIINKNEEVLNESLFQIVKGYRNNKWLHEFKDPILKLIGNYPIGLYKLGKHYLKNEDVNLILPEHPVIWKEFAELKQKAEPYILFKESLVGLNDYLKNTDNTVYN
ncbi:hypothetical protein [Winogradskyella sp. Asnod2-B02-A]|uniref:hypothetical protein n=1 Tax=unclassified Winogradskyella TaxID=2615021 RepID=UPI003866D7BB